MVGGILKEAWCSETSSTPDLWTPERPAIGQCAVTSLVVQDLFGGELIRVMAFDRESHYFNRVGGSDIDFTSDQFPFGYWTTGGKIVREREYVLSFPDTVKRYELLKRRIAG